jgi:lipid A 4'-phosphatase
VIFPEIDIETSRLFFSPEAGFKHKNHIIVVWIFRFIPNLTSAWIGILVLYVIYQIFRLKNKKEVIKLPAIFLIISALIGPGFVVNYVLKENWGRARPNVISEFGGEKRFHRAGVISDQCVSNCSFSSGHASMGYYFTSFAWIVPIYLQNITFVATFLFGTIVGVGRIAQGGHFLSDVAFSFLIVTIVNYTSYSFWIYLKKKYKK